MRRVLGERERGRRSWGGGEPKSWEVQSTFGGSAMSGIPQSEMYCWEWRELGLKMCLGLVGESLRCCPEEFGLDFKAVSLL